MQTRVVIAIWKQKSCMTLLPVLIGESVLSGEVGWLKTSLWAIVAEVGNRHVSTAPLTHHETHHHLIGSTLHLVVHGAQREAPT